MIYPHLFLFYRTTIGLVCAWDKRFPDCDTRMNFVESQGFNDLNEAVNGWIAYVREGSLASILPVPPVIAAITSSQGSSQACEGAPPKLPCLCIPVFVSHHHDGKKEEFKRGLPKEVKNIAQRIFNERDGEVTASKLRAAVPFMCCMYTLFIYGHSYVVPTACLLCSLKSQLTFPFLIPAKRKGSLCLAIVKYNFEAQR